MPPNIETIVDEAATHSVTRENLTGTVFDDGYTNIPPIELLDDEELVHVWGRGYSNGFAVGHKKNGRRRVSGSAHPILMATDRRLLFQVPKSSHDLVHSVPLSAVTDTEMESGWVKTRLTFHTVDDDYHFYPHDTDEKTIKGWYVTFDALLSNYPETEPGIRTYPRYFSRAHTPEVFDSPQAREFVLSSKYRPKEHDSQLTWKPYDECPHCSTYNFTLFAQSKFSEGRPLSKNYDWGPEENAAALYCDECEYQEVLIE